MKNYLLVSGSPENLKTLTSMTGAVPETETSVSLTASEAGQLMESGNYSAMIVNTPLRDGQGLDLCVYVCEKLCYPVVLITSQKTAERVREDYTEKGIIVLSRPLDRSSYHLVLGCLSAYSGFASRLRIHSRELEEELAERRLVARAKARLMKNMGMTEDQAHRFIAKQSMDLRCSRKDIAQHILKTYL